ncbi:hypothetical protein [Bernardetia sp.]|uniref:hypothetical protein n=1 Tax=Bernardetia sp. TaxID=1937974 RepID=UPI0025BED100|nr:hypothetical protein [Bernardetia sp.]
MEIFKLGNYNFGIEKNELVLDIERKSEKIYVSDIEIRGNEAVFENLLEDDDFECSWSLYPPYFYARQVKLDTNDSLRINEDNIDDYDVGIYLMEHFDVDIVIKIDEGYLSIDGIAIIDNQEYTMRTQCKLI